MTRFLALLLLPAFALPSQALQLRTYNAAVHDRFTGFKANPVMNPGFLYNAGLYTGVGYIVANGDGRQFTLVTPRHFVCATHYKPNPGELVRFVDANGVVLTRSVASVAVISYPMAGTSDLALGTLDSALPSTVGVFPYLNLANEGAYNGKELVVLGFFARGGRGSIAGFDDIDGAPYFDESRGFYFEYLNSGGGPNDCHFQTGDSGSPSFFVTVNGQPALVGIHTNLVTSAFPPPGKEINYDTFVPHYITQLNAELVASGYRMRPVNGVAAATLALATASSPATQRQAHPGTVTFTMDNSGASTTHNAAMTLTFAPGQAPASVATPGGWVTESLGGGVWSIRKATMTTTDNAVATATWTSLPAVATMTVNVVRESEGSAATSSNPSFALAPSYAAWAAGLTEAGQGDDPDDDGAVNLLEYALGGNPQSGALTIANGGPLLPVLAHQAGTVSFSFPERSDAVLRGLSYVVETLVTLESPPWSATLPAGASSSTQPFIPDVPGFVKRTVTWPADGPKRFARVKVELAE